MLISDWSSDVCSSDLAVQSLPPPKLSVLFLTSPDPVTIVRPVAGLISLIPAATRFFLPPRPPNALNSAPPIGTFDTMLLAAPERTSPSTAADLATRSDKRRAGKEVVSTCRHRWDPYH